MEEANRCPECGAEVEQDGTCPACLLKLGLSGAIPAMPESESQPLAAPRAQTPARSVRRWRPQWRLGWKWPLAIVMAGAALLASATLRRSEPFRSPVVRFTIAPPDDATIGDFAVSPDGRYLAFTAAGVEGQAKLWVRRFDALEGQELPGTEGAAAPFWSPDSRMVGFLAAGKLKRIDLGGGPPMTLADAPFAGGGSWSPQGVIVFAGRGNELLRVAASGGDVTPVTHGAENGGLRWPFFLPDGVSYLYYASGGRAGTSVGRLDTGETRKIADGEAAIYSDGRLIYTRGGTLLSQPFDDHRLVFTGDPVAVRFAEAVRAGNTRAPAFSTGQGVLAFRNGDAPMPRVLLWMDRQGGVTDRVGDTAEEGEFSLSPDGRKIAYTRGDRPAAADLWVRDMNRGTSTRLTFDGPGAASPKWSPDGRKIAYVVSARGKGSIKLASADGSGGQEMLLELQQAAALDDWSADTRFLIYTSRELDGNQAVWMLPLHGESKPGKPAVALHGPFRLKQARLSPDGRWIAYVSDEAGREDVYVQSFPPGNGKWMVSNEGGAHPVWRRDGRELFYIHAQRRLMSSEIRSGAVLEPGAPRPLLELPGNGSFELAPDGQRLLVSAPSREERPEPIQIVLQWAAETRP